MNWIEFLADQLIGRRSKPVTAVIEPPPSNLQFGESINRESAKKKGHWNEVHRNKLFEDLNGNGSKFVNCDFSYSIFVRGYFHKTKFENCSFIGCRFYDSNFREARFSSTDFRYSSFQNTLIPALEIIPNLPPEPNLRRDVLQRLKVNAWQVGDIEGMRKFTDEEIKATNDHLKRAFRGQDYYYKEKYPSTWDKISLASQLFGHSMSGFFWGHGERPWRLLGSLLLILALGSIANLFAVPVASQQSMMTIASFAVGHSIDLFLGLSNEVGEGGFLIVDYALVVMRYVYIGLFITVLAKYISFR